MDKQINILVDNFCEQITITMANGMCSAGVIKIIAGFTEEKFTPENSNDDMVWLRRGDAVNYRHEIFHKVDLIVSLANLVELEEITRLAIHHGKPLLCCAGNINASHLEQLQRASYYVPVVYYNYHDDRLETITDTIAHISGKILALPVQGEVIKRGHL